MSQRIDPRNRQMLISYMESLCKALGVSWTMVWPHIYNYLQGTSDYTISEVIRITKSYAKRFK